ncbi:very short patch repair endonuclease [Promicromonospora sp. NPDC023987]|uniref:very short patch repair endonuclease n=1 Tax=Promicromonospora sp. NPDC023987 TaxID=3155360 RepID=UPI0033DE2EFB
MSDGQPRAHRVAADQQVATRMVPQHVSAHPGSSSTGVSARMSRARRRDTAPEVALRRELHARGLRYRVAYPVPGQRRRTIDITFTRLKVAVFVDGCFWHGCPEHGTKPRSNSAWWQEKLAANAARDADTDRALTELGWLVIRVWEHDLDLRAADLVEKCVRGRSAPVASCE